MGIPTECGSKFDNYIKVALSLGSLYVSATRCERTLRGEGPGDEARIRVPSSMCVLE